MTGPLIAEFRNRARQQREAANVLLAGSEILTDPKKQVAATVGHVASHLFDALADLVEYQQADLEGDTMASRRRAILERNNAIRKAAARGDWNEFDRLTGITPGDSADSGGSPPGGNAIDAGG